MTKIIAIIFAFIATTATAFADTAPRVTCVRETNALVQLFKKAEAPVVTVVNHTQELDNKSEISSTIMVRYEGTLCVSQTSISVATYKEDARIATAVRESAETVKAAAIRGVDSAKEAAEKVAKMAADSAKQASSSAHALFEKAEQSVKGML